MPLLLLAAYWAVALGLYLRWERENWYPTTGDEPHHIVIGRSVVHHGSLELTDYYLAEARRQGRPGEIPAPGAQHTIANLDRLWSVHSVGTGILAVPAIALTDVLDYHNDVLLVRLTFVALSGAAVIAAWVLATLYVTGTAPRVIAVAITCLSLPLLIAANQVFPDLPAGIVALCALAYVAWRSRQTEAPALADCAAMALIATIPFLHYKLAPMAAILAIAVLMVILRSGAGPRRILGVCVVPAIATLLFFAYNIAVDGDLMPTAPGTSIHIDATTLRWMFTFSVDRWHGFLIQSPAFFIGVLFFVPFLKRHPIVAVPALLCYLAAMGVNAAHGAPGFSFAGRHAWTGGMMMVPAVIYGVGCIGSMSQRVLYALAAVFFALQVVALAPLLRSDHDLTNQPSETWFDVYPSFFPETVNRFLPAIYNNEWWGSFALNYLYIAFAAALILIGAFVYPRRRDFTLPAAGGLLAVTLPLVVLVSFVQADPPREPRRWLGSEMHRNFGTVLPRTVEADIDMHSAGIWTFGPYMKVAPGDYRVTFVYSADAPPDVKVGSWDVTGRAGRVRFAAGDLYGSNGLRAVATGTLTVESRSDGESFEMRTRFDDVADLLLGEIVLEPAD